MHDSKQFDDCPYDLDIAARMSLVEITDNAGSPFLLMPEHIVKKKKMHHRIIFVVLKDRKNKILLVKKKSEQKNVLWEFPCYGIVYAGESAEGTAYRELEKHFFIDDSIVMKEIATLPYLQEDSYVQATVFLAGPYYGINSANKTFLYNEETIQDAMFIDKEEFEGLLSFNPEMFNPIITWAYRANWLYK